MHAAIVELEKTGEFKGSHYLDIFHILKNVKKKLEIKEHVFLFKRLVHARNQSHYLQCLEDAEEKLTAREKPILERFKSMAHRFCFSQIKTEFIGFSCSSSPN